MAIEIKAIQCPACGSTDKIEIKTDQYRCENCGTEYVLDDGSPRQEEGDGVPHVHVVERTPAQTALLIGIPVLIVLIAVLVTVATSSGPNYTGSSVAEVEQGPTWQYSNSFVYVSSDKRPIVVATGTVRNNEPAGQHAEPFVFFIDALTDSIIRQMPVPGRDHTSSEGSWHFQQLSNGDLYGEVGGESLYLIDKVSYGIKDVTQSFAADQPELESGIAKVELIPGLNQDGFHVVTNDGKQLYYFPFLHKVYTQHAFFLAQTGMSSVLPSAKPATGFFFWLKRSDDGVDSDRLIKFQYLDNGVGPKQPEFCEWQSNGEPAALKPNFQRIISRMNFTPGRLYFQPRVLMSDDDYVLISFAPTASGSNHVVQCLDARTSAIVFTARLDGSAGGATRYKDGFAIYYGSVTLVDMKGNVKALRNDNK